MGLEVSSRLLRSLFIVYGLVHIAPLLHILHAMVSCIHGNSAVQCLPLLCLSHVYPLIHFFTLVMLFCCAQYYRSAPLFMGTRSHRHLIISSSSSSSFPSPSNIFQATPSRLHASAHLDSELLRLFIALANNM